MWGRNCPPYKSRTAVRLQPNTVRIIQASKLALDEAQGYPPATRRVGAHGRSAASSPSSLKSYEAADRPKLRFSRGVPDTKGHWARPRGDREGRPYRGENQLHRTDIIPRAVYVYEVKDQIVAQHEYLHAAGSKAA